MNKNSKVLALKYRPQTFDDLIGQEVVAETITNSIKSRNEWREIVKEENLLTGRIVYYIEQKRIGWFLLNR